jgi:A/G-specific adenine glycosylase
VEKLASADLQTVLKTWEGMGYYARARNLHRAARQVVKDFSGTIPSDPEVFRKLPGVGEYIASAVLSIAFDRAFAVVDGNVKRVLSRMFAIEAPVNQSSSYNIFKETSQALLIPEKPGTYNQAVMELGAMICKPRQPACDACPLPSVCSAYQQNRVDQYPKRIRRSKTPEYRMVVGIVHKNGRLLITQRKPDGLLGGLWEFPGGRIIEEKTVEEACVKRVKEAVNLTVEVQEHLIRVRHAYTHFKIAMEVFRCRYTSGRVKLSSAVDFRWVRPEEIDAYPLHRANHKFIHLLRPSK